VTQESLQSRLLVGHGHEEEFIAHLQRVIRGRGDDVRAAHDGDKCRVGWPVLIANATSDHR
jgi:hypothetical protein